MSGHEHPRTAYIGTARTDVAAIRLAVALSALFFAGDGSSARAATQEILGHIRIQPISDVRAPSATSSTRTTGVSLAPFAVASEEGKDAKNSKANAEEQDAPRLPASAPPELSPAQQYCSNVIDAASAAQIAQQTSKLEKAQKELDERIALLAAKTEVLKGWIKTRQEFTARATDSLLQIYSKMKPDAAGGQLSAMDELVAAAIMSKLSPKVSSLILAEMEVGKAARLSAIIAGAGEITMKPERKADAQQ